MFGRKKKKYWVLPGATGEFTLEVDGDHVPAEEVTAEALKSMKSGANFPIAVLRSLAARYHFLVEADAKVFLALCQKVGGPAQQPVNTKAPAPKAKAPAPAAAVKPLDDEAAIAKIQVKPVNDADFDAFIASVTGDAAQAATAATVASLDTHLSGPSDAIAIVKRIKGDKPTLVIETISIKLGDKVKYADEADVERVRTGEIEVAQRRVYRDRAHAEAMFAALRIGITKKKSQ